MRVEARRVSPVSQVHGHLWAEGSWQQTPSCAIRARVRFPFGGGLRIKLPGSFATYNATSAAVGLTRGGVERSPICRPGSDCWDVKGDVLPSEQTPGRRTEGVPIHRGYERRDPSDGGQGSPLGHLPIPVRNKAIKSLPGSDSPAPLGAQFTVPVIPVRRTMTGRRIMKLPNHTQPVSRLFGTPVRVHTSSGMGPSGNCGTGQWCCKPIFGGASRCVDCSIKAPIFGNCLSLQQVDCATHGMLPAYDC